ncbi:MAG TPA: mechanosensitive ion channel family protein [Polyangiaceae bacterium]|nr:mechanosensitive ion channel family protein [Polyangiaceae bacterium]
MDVRLNERVLFRIYAGHGAQTAEQRAQAAEEALDSTDVEPEEVRVEQQYDVAVIFAGKVPVVQLYERDAALAGDASLDVHAATTAAQIREALRSEQKRSAIASTVFSFSLVIFFGLLALYLIRKVGDLAARARAFIHDNPDRIPALRVQSIEVIRPALLRGVLQAALGLGRWVLQFGIAYGWLVFALSLFAATRAYTERLTGFVTTPIAALLARFAASLPVLLVAGIAAAAVYVLVRFVGLFFAGVARGETHLPWLPADLAAPTSFLLRASIVVGALVFGAPVVTGDPEGALARSGAVLLGALALASTPLLACGVTGAAFVFLRRLRVGDYTEFGGRSGRVLEIGLLEVRLEDAQGCEVRVPHLLSLIHPTRVLGAAPPVSIELSVPTQPLRRNIRELLLEGIAGVGDDPTVEVVSIDAHAVRLRLSVRSADAAASALLQARALDVLSNDNKPVRPAPGIPRTS